MNGNKPGSVRRLQGVMRLHLARGSCSACASSPGTRGYAARVCIGQKGNTDRRIVLVSYCLHPCMQDQRLVRNIALNWAALPPRPTMMELRSGEQSPLSNSGMAIRQILVTAKSWSYGYEPVGCPQCVRERTSPLPPLSSGSGRERALDRRRIEPAVRCSSSPPMRLGCGKAA